MVVLVVVVLVVVVVVGKKRRCFPHYLPVRTSTCLLAAGCGLRCSTCSQQRAVVSRWRASLACSHTAHLGALRHRSRSPVCSQRISGQRREFLRPEQAQSSQGMISQLRPAPDGRRL